MSRREPGEGPTNAAPASGRAARAGRHAPKPSPAAAPGQPLRAGGYTDEHASAGLQAELPAIFQENATNRILRDVVAACEPLWCEVRGVFAPRGGMSTRVVARYERRADEQAGEQE